MSQPSSVLSKTQTGDRRTRKDPQRSCQVGLRTPERVRKAHKLAKLGSNLGHSLPDGLRDGDGDGVIGIGRGSGGHG
jgi:hypothetical protein